MDKRVAIVEDDPSQRRVLSGLLELKGYQVVAEASSGEDALALCKELRPDVVIMDINMPGMDGLEAAREINEESPTAVVMLSARDDDEAVRKAYEAGAMGYLIKPVGAEALYAAMEVAIFRFRELEKLLKENAELKDSLEARKYVERAKGLLMEAYGLTEDEAFKRLRKLSMDGRKPMVDVAKVITLSLEERGVGKEKPGV